jgi:hypothetical protein
MIASGVTKENVAAFTELVKLSEHMEDRQAKKDFAMAYAKMQAEIPRIKATEKIPDRNGNMRSSFAPFEVIDAQAGPICRAHGFTYSFKEGAFMQGRVTKICILQHIGGFEREHPYSVRIGQGPPGCSESQADGSAHSYAKRGALCDALNIVVVGMDDDAKLEGGPITPVEAALLRARVKATKSNEEFFLKFAGATSFETIPSSKLGLLNDQLARKEKHA